MTWPRWSITARRTRIGPQAADLRAVAGTVAGVVAPQGCHERMRPPGRCRRGPARRRVASLPVSLLAPVTTRIRCTGRSFRAVRRPSADIESNSYSSLFSFCQCCPLLLSKTDQPGRATRSRAQRGGDPMAAGLDGADAGARQGLSWSWQLDFDALARCIDDDGSAG